MYLEFFHTFVTFVKKRCPMILGLTFEPCPDLQGSQMVAGTPWTPQRPPARMARITPSTFWAPGSDVFLEKKHRWPTKTQQLDPWLLDVTWCYLMLLDVTWCYLMLLDVTWCYLMLLDVTWCYLMLITWCYLMLLDVTWCYLMLITWCYLMLLDVTWCYLMLLDVTWC